MLFHSPTFVFFALGVFGLYAIARTSRTRTLVLLVASYLFYVDWNYRYLPLLLLSTGIDFFAARRTYDAEPGWRRRAWLLCSLVANLGLLGTFKYANFVLAQMGPVWRALDASPPELPGEIPIGISFYTFQTLSYSIDCYRRRVQPCRRLSQFALYVAFFPQLIAGPIVRASEFLPQVQHLASLRAANVAEGLQRFVLGLFKKVVIADNVGLFVDGVFAYPESHAAVTLWCGAYAFALQIYYDFSAYTDMALGLARGFGIRLPENFSQPYLSASITEFWRRWHTSLSRWLRDYLYVPLGGSRTGVRRTYLNLMLTMLLGGFWHGAGWNFALWGLFHGGLLALERALGIGTMGDGLAERPVRRALHTVATFQLVCIGWVMFRSGDFAAMGSYLRGMLGGSSGSLWWDPGSQLGLAWTALLLGLVGLERLAARPDWQSRWQGLHPSFQGAALAAAALLVSVWHVDAVAFIYFQF